MHNQNCPTYLSMDSTTTVDDEWIYNHEHLTSFDAKGRVDRPFVAVLKMRPCGCEVRLYRDVVMRLIFLMHRSPKHIIGGKTLNCPQPYILPSCYVI